MNYAFADLVVAQRLKAFANEPYSQHATIVLDNEVAWVFESPSAGIPAFDGYDSPTDGDVVPSALCKVWYLVEYEGEVTLKKAKLENGEQLSLRVANLAPSEISGGRLGRATRCVGNALLVDWFPCSV